MRCSDGHGANSMTDRLDVTLIEPSGQMFTATTGNQPQGVPGQRNQGAGDLSSLLGPLVQQIASGVMNNLQTPGHAGEPNPAAQAMQAVASVLGRLSGSQSGWHWHQIAVHGRVLLCCSSTDSKPGDPHATPYPPSLNEYNCDIYCVHGVYFGQQGISPNPRRLSGMSMQSQHMV